MNGDDEVQFVEQIPPETAAMYAQMEAQLRVHAVSFAVQLLAESAKYGETTIQGGSFITLFDEVFKALTGRE